MTDSKPQSVPQLEPYGNRKAWNGQPWVPMWQALDRETALLARLNELEEQLEAAQRELQDATRMVAALVYRANKTSGVLFFPNDLSENLTLSRHDNPIAKTIHLFASNPASEPKEN